MPSPPCLLYLHLLSGRPAPALDSAPTPPAFISGRWSSPSESRSIACLLPRLCRSLRFLTLSWQPSRGQANQRRQPESFHFHQLHVQQQTASLLKVELKQFILSILDDRIVSRVLAEAGFRRYDVKFAIMHLPITQSSQFSRKKYPPLFLCNLTDSDPGRRSLSFPFPCSFAGEDGDETCRRIGEILVRKSTRNPLLIGVCAAAALQNFTDCVQTGKSGVFPAQISGLGITCISKEILEFLNGTGSREKLGLKLKQVGLLVEKISGPGVALNYGELNTLVGDDVPEANVSFVVSKLTDLTKLHGEKLWSVGAAGTYETYEKLLPRFPAIEREWDLHFLPITSSKSSFEGFGSKSRLLVLFLSVPVFIISMNN